MDLAEAGEVRYCTICRAVYHSEFARCPNDGGALALSAIDPLLGTTVAQYEIDAYVGGGAMGRVYRCHHTHLQHKQFALKVLRGDLAATLAMRLRFTQEAEAASRLVHPNVVSVTDFGCTEDGLLYLAMDYVEGDSLATLIDAGPISPARTIAIVRQLCHGLGHAHSLGLVHRDLKPENVIVCDGEVRIVDFGLAIRTGGDSESARLTTAGATVGTPVYAAPEQMQTEDVDQRADLFALGVTMFEMLAGRTPFDGNLVEVLHMNISGERPTIASRARLPVTVPPRLERLVHRLMASSRHERPASTADVLTELDAIERGEELPPKRRTRVWIGAGIAAAGLAIAGVAVYVGTRPPSEPVAASAPAIEAPKIEAPKVVAADPPKVVAADSKKVEPAAPEFDAIVPSPMIPEPAVPRTRATRVMGHNAATRAKAIDARPGDGAIATAGAKSVGDGAASDKVADATARPDKVGDATARPTNVVGATGADATGRVTDKVGDAGGRATDKVGDATARPSNAVGATGRPDNTVDATRRATDTTAAKPDKAGGASDVKRDKVGDATAANPDKAGDATKRGKVGDGAVAAKLDGGTAATKAPPKVATSATLSLDGLSVRGSLTPAQVKRALDRVTQTVRGCYGPSAKQAGRSPKVALRTRFEIDESQHARGIRTVSAAGDLPGLSACVDRALGGLWSEQAPDVGTVDVSLVLQFSPEGT